MAYIGNIPAEKYSAFQKQDFTTSATTSYTLDNPVANANELALFINNVRQEPTTAYSASSTSLTLTEATSASDDMYCVYLGKAVQTVNPPNASVGTSQLADNGVTSAKLSYPLTTFSSTGIDDNASATAMTINSSGSITNSSQPAFQATKSTQQSNISSGDTITFNGESFDQQNNFASNTFTAPITGKYKFDFLVSVLELDYNASYNRLKLVSSNRTYNFGITSQQMFNGANPTYFSFQGSLLVDMDASDTCHLQWHQIGGTSSADVFDSTYFSGHLVC